MNARYWRRLSWWCALAFLLGLAISGCVTRGPDFEGDQYHYRARPTTVRVEAEHISHPFIGFPFNLQPEGQITQGAVISRWQTSGAYFELGAGYRVSGDLQGPDLTGIVRAGYEWRIP